MGCLFFLIKAFFFVPTCLFVKIRFFFFFHVCLILVSGVGFGSKKHLSHGKLVPLPSRYGPSMLSYHSRADFLKLNLYPGLSLLSSLEVCCL